MSAGRRNLAIAVAVVAAYVVTAVVTLGARHPVRPLFEGIQPLQPYQWVNPPARFATGNVKPGVAKHTVGFQDGSSVAATVTSPDQQLILSVPTGAFPAHGADTGVLVTGTPVDPGTLGAVPAGLDPDGNAYRVTFAYQPSGQAIAAPAKPGQVVLGVPSPATTLLFSADGKTWTKLDLDGSPTTSSIGSSLKSAGWFLAAGPPGTVPVGGTTKSNTGQIVLIVVVVILLALVLGLAPTLVRRLRRGRGRGKAAPAGRRPPPRQPPLRPGAKKAPAKKAAAATSPAPAKKAPPAKTAPAKQAPGKKPPKRRR